MHFKGTVAVNQTAAQKSRCSELDSCSTIVSIGIVQPDVGPDRPGAPPKHLLANWTPLVCQPAGICAHLARDSYSEFTKNNSCGWEGVYLAILSCEDFYGCLSCPPDAHTCSLLSARCPLCVILTFKQLHGHHVLAILGMYLKVSDIPRTCSSPHWSTTLP